VGRRRAPTRTPPPCRRRLPSRRCPIYLGGARVPPQHPGTEPAVSTYLRSRGPTSKGRAGRIQRAPFARRLGESLHSPKTPFGAPESSIPDKASAPTAVARRCGQIVRQPILFPYRWKFPAPYRVDVATVLTDFETVECSSRKRVGPVRRNHSPRSTVILSGVRRTVCYENRYIVYANHSNNLDQTGTCGPYSRLCQFDGSWHSSYPRMITVFFVT
jgi:hypothetical protein